MGYTNAALEDRILDMFPEIGEQGISVSLDFSKEKKAYVIKFKKDNRELKTNLEKKDADECMDGIKCIHLSIQIARFLENFVKGK